MTKIETSLEEIVSKIEAFYDEKKHHFLTLNGVAIEQNVTEIQWIFAPYDNAEDITIFYILVSDDITLPSISHLIPSAVISQREVVDMFGIKIEDTDRGLYLDEDSLQKPLSLGCAL